MRLPAAFEPLPARLEKNDPSGNRNIQRFDAGGHRDPDRGRLQKRFLIYSGSFVPQKNGAWGCQIRICIAYPFPRVRAIQANGAGRAIVEKV